MGHGSHGPWYERGKRRQWSYTWRSTPWAGSGPPVVALRAGPVSHARGGDRGEAPGSVGRRVAADPDDHDCLAAAYRDGLGADVGLVAEPVHRLAVPGERREQAPGERPGDALHDDAPRIARAVAVASGLVHAHPGIEERQRG